MEHVRYILIGAALLGGGLFVAWLLSEFWLARQVVKVLFVVGICWAAGFMTVSRWKYPF
jgi:hypothetical protein